MITRILISIIVYCLAGWLFCDIDPTNHYEWYHGIWHGLFFVANFVRSFFMNCVYKASDYTTAYNVFYWIFSISSVLGALGGGAGSRQD